MRIADLTESFESFTKANYSPIQENVWITLNMTLVELNNYYPDYKQAAFSEFNIMKITVNHYNSIIGTEADGNTLFYRLAPKGKKILAHIGD